MTSRERQLLLELLLLAERYSSDEIRETAKVLKQLPIASDLLKAFEAAAFSGSHSIDNLASVKIESHNKDVTLTIEEFIDQLGSPASLKSRRRISSAAKRLLIPDEGKETADLLQLVRERLRNMDQDALSKFLRAYKSPTRPDENYLELARFLIKENKDDVDK